jgi:hypothetical protein
MPAVSPNVSALQYGKTSRTGRHGVCGGHRSGVLRAPKEEAMIVFGMFLLVLAIPLKIEFLSTVGLIFLVVGGVLSILGYLGRPVGGRRYWY